MLGQAIARKSGQPRLGLAENSRTIDSGCKFAQSARGYPLTIKSIRTDYIVIVKSYYVYTYVQ